MIYECLINAKTTFALDAFDKSSCMNSELLRNTKVYYTNIAETSDLFRSVLDKIALTHL